MTADLAGLQVYLVGGAVRDDLLGLQAPERDWVVVGSDADTLLARGFTPADSDFPVFLHPDTGEEYALARRETKSGSGYRGFEIDAGADVTLDEDLQRRDLTINALAQSSDGRLVDRFGGREDLDARLLRHVSPAFVEDPVRVLRSARFAAKLGAFGFRVAHGTHRLMLQMVERGDMRQIRRERLWREMSAALQTSHPWRFFEVLQRCGALGELIPPLALAMGEAAAHDEAPDSPPIMALKKICRESTLPGERLAGLLFSCVDSPTDADALLADLRADRDTGQALRRVVAAKPFLLPAAEGSSDALYGLLRTWRGFDRATDVDGLLAICAANIGQPMLTDHVRLALSAARSVDAAQLAVAGGSGAALGKALQVARQEAIRAALGHRGLLT